MATLTMRLENGPIELDLPDGWRLNRLPVSNTPALSVEEMRGRLASPIGTPPIREIARGKRTAVIIVDDLTRPTPAADFVPLIIEELEAGGVPDEGIKIIGGVGCHRPMLNVDFRAKVGDWVVDRFECVTHNPYEHVTYVGTTASGIRVEINDEVAEAEVKIVAGGIIPHGAAGFGGGAKLILPGVCSIATTSTHHSGKYQGASRCVVEGNGFRDELVAIARVARLDAIVNCVMNADLGVAGLFVGDVAEAHHAGCRAARELYTVRPPRGVDGAIVSGFPQDREFGQSLKGMHRCPETVRDGGSVLFVTAGTEGPGFHYLGERGRKKARHEPEKPPASPVGPTRELIVYCPTVGPQEVARRVPSSASFHRDIASAVADLVNRLPSNATVNVFPQGAMTIVE